MAFQRIVDVGSRRPKQMLIGVILVIALAAFEMFNFDTTQYALENLLGAVGFAGLGWATILAVAFCGIDLAGLVRLFTPQRGEEEPREVWYLMSAWLLGATMNAVMTWWAVSLTLLSHDFGNEVLSREQLLRYVPVFVAVLVWLTRILFIGSLTVAGEHLLERQPATAGDMASAMPRLAAQSQQTVTPSREKAPRPAAAAARNNGPTARKPRAARAASTPPVPAPQVAAEEFEEPEAPSAPPLQPRRSNGPANGRINGPSNGPTNGRVRQRPPIPGTRPASLNASPRQRR